MNYLVDGKPQPCENPWGLKINFNKTEYLTLKTEDEVKLEIEEEEIHKDNKFKYLGSILEADGRSSAEIEKRISREKNN